MVMWLTTDRAHLAPPCAPGIVITTAVCDLFTERLSHANRFFLTGIQYVILSRLHSSCREKLQRNLVCPRINLVLTKDKSWKSFIWYVSVAWPVELRPLRCTGHWNSIWRKRWPVQKPSLSALFRNQRALSHFWFPHTHFGSRSTQPPTPPPPLTVGWSWKVKGRCQGSPAGGRKSRSSKLSSKGCLLNELFSLWLWV